MHECISFNESLPSNPNRTVETKPSRAWTVNDLPSNPGRYLGCRPSLVAACPAPRPRQSTGAGAGSLRGPVHRFTEADLKREPARRIRRNMSFRRIGRRAFSLAWNVPNALDAPPELRPAVLLAQTPCRLGPDVCKIIHEQIPPPISTPRLLLLLPLHASPVRRRHHPPGCCCSRTSARLNKFL